MNRKAVIDKMMNLMSLSEWSDMVIGDEKSGEGLPKHVRKRLTVAIQLVMLPKILFLDVSNRSTVWHSSFLQAFD